MFSNILCPLFKQDDIVALLDLGAENIRIMMCCYDANELSVLYVHKCPLGASNTNSMRIKILEMIKNAEEGGNAIVNKLALSMSSSYTRNVSINVSAKYHSNVIIDRTTINDLLRDAIGKCYNMTDKDKQDSTEQCSNIHNMNDFVIIDFHDVSYTLDERMKVVDSPVGLSCHSIEVDCRFSLALRSQLSLMNQLVHDCGIDVVRFIPKAEAMVAWHDANNSCPDAVMMLNFGFSEVIIVIYDDGKMVKSDIIKEASSYIIQSIARHLSISLEEASAIHLDYNINHLPADCSVENHEIFSITMDCYDYIMTQIESKLNEIGYRHKINRIMLSGGMTQMHNFQNIVAERFGLDCFIVAPIELPLESQDSSNIILSGMMSYLMARHKAFISLDLYTNSISDKIAQFGCFLDRLFIK